MMGKEKHRDPGRPVRAARRAGPVFPVAEAQPRALQPAATPMLLARFDNIGGLKARAPVRSAGVDVGR